MTFDRICSLAAMLMTFVLVQAATSAAGVAVGSVCSVAPAPHASSGGAGFH
jgi:hypothetical protein